MKSVMWKTLFITCVASALTLGACKKEQPKSVDEVAQKAEPKTEAPKEEPKNEEAQTNNAATAAQTNNTAGEKEVDEAMYLKTIYEVTCVQAKIEDPEKQKGIIAEILPRYGFNAESFKAAQAKVGEKENVKLALKSRMEKCTSAEIAEGFSKAGATAESEEKTEEAKKPAKPKPAYVGQLKQMNLKSGDIEGGRVILNIRPDFKINGFFSGKREGKAFNIALSGTVSKKGALKANGKQGSNSAALAGNLSNKSSGGVINGSINKKPFKVRYSAKK